LQHNNKPYFEYVWVMDGIRLSDNGVTSDT